MSELAFDLNGDPIVLPASAQFWRVRRFRTPGARGAPEVVETKDGAPMIIPIDTGFVEFRELVESVPGRYRLDPLDERRKILPNAPAAYLTLSEPARNGNAAAPSPAAVEREDVIAALLRSNSDLARMQADVARNLTDRFAGMMEAAAVLIQAADGAGIVARLPIEPNADDVDDVEMDEPAPTPAADEAPLVALMKSLAPAVNSWMAIRAAKASAQPPGRSRGTPSPPPVPPRRAHGASARRQARPAPAAPRAVETPTGGGPQPTGSPTAEQMARLLAIQEALTADERVAAQAAAAGLPDADRARLMDELCSLSLEDAVAKIRAMLASEPGAEAAS